MSAACVVAGSIADVLFGRTEDNGDTTPHPCSLAAVPSRAPRIVERFICHIPTSSR